MLGFGNKRKSKPKLSIAWDTETYKTVLEDGTILVKPYLIGWFCEGEFYYSTEPHTKFFEFLAEKSKTYKLIMWAFNANYDLTVLIPKYLTDLPKFSIDYKVSEARSFIKCVIRCKQFRFTVKDASVWDRSNPSLDSWFKLLGISSKVEGFIYDKWDAYISGDRVLFQDSKNNPSSSSLLDELKYLRWDCEGLLKVVDYQENQKKELCKMTIPYKKRVTGYTAPSMSVKLINAFMCEMDWFNKTFRPVIECFEDVEKIYTHMNHSNIGGFTAFNSDRYQWEFEEEKIFSYDINSMYPYIMFKGLPSGKLLYKKPKSGEFYTWREIRVNKCEWIDKYKNISAPAIPQRVLDSPKNFFIIEEYYQFVLRNTVNDIEILETYYQVKNTDLSRFIRNAYNIKLKAKDIEDEEKKKNGLGNIKLILNSIYGKLCERTYTKEHYYDPEICDFIGKDVFVNEYRYTLSGAFVSQMGRLIMMSVITKEINNGNVFIYSDTDSIKLVVNNPVKFPVHPINLGFFKNEGWGSECRGFTNFHHNGSLKKNLIFSNKDIKKSIKLTLSGIVKDIHKDLLNNASIEVLKDMFSTEKRIVIAEGGKDRRKNKFGQKLLGRSMVCIRGSFEKGTHILEKVGGIWKISKFEKNLNLKKIK